MNEKRNKFDISEYEERHRFWMEKRLSQVSFHNNLLLAFGVAVIGYFWKDYEGITEPDGLVLVAASVVIGFMMSLSRLYDMRLTANMLLTKKRLAKRGEAWGRHPLRSECYCLCLMSWLLVVFRYPKYAITKRDIQAGRAHEKLRKAEQHAENLGKFTWFLMFWQTATMFIGLICIVFCIKFSSIWDKWAHLLTFNPT